MPVRLLKNGGSPVVKAENGAENDDKKKDKEKEVDPNLLDLGSAKVDRNSFTTYLRNDENLSDYFDSKEGFNSNKLRSKVGLRVRQFGDAVLRGDMTLDGISTFMHNNPIFASDGSLKRRPMRKVYDWKDENTVNALAAAVLLDTINNNPYIEKPAEKKPLEGDENGDGKVDDDDKPEFNSGLNNYFTDQFGEGYYKGFNELMASREAADRYGFATNILQNWYNWMGEAINSGKYRISQRTKREYEALDKLLQSGAFANEASYLANRNQIDATLSAAPNIAQWFGRYNAPAPQKEETEMERTQREIAEEEERLKANKEADKLNDIRSFMKFSAETIRPFISHMDSDDYVGLNPNGPGAYQLNPFNDASKFGNQKYMKWFTDAFGRRIQAGDSDNAWKYLYNAFADYINNNIRTAANPEMRKAALTNTDKNAVRNLIAPIIRAFDPEGKGDYDDDFYANMNVGDILSSYLYGMRELNKSRSDGNRLTNTWIIRDPEQGSYGVAYFTPNFSFGYTDLKTARDKNWITTEDIVMQMTKDWAKNNPYDESYFTKQKLWELYNYGSPQSDKNGGVIKGQTGLKMMEINNAPAQTTQSVNGQPTQPATTQWSNDPYMNDIYERIDREKKVQDAAYARAQAAGQGYINEKFGTGNYDAEHAGTLTPFELDENDYWRIASAVPTIASIVASLSGVGSLAGAGIGAVGTIMNAIADFRDEDISRGDAWTNLFTNLGMDALSLVPVIGASGGVGKAVKIIKNLYTPLSIGFAAIGAKDALSTIGRLINGEKVSNQDWANLLNGMTVLAKFGKNTGMRKFNNMTNDEIEFGKLSDKNRIIQVADKKGIKKFMRLSDEDYKELTDAGQRTGGMRLSASETRKRQQKRFKEMYGDEYKLVDSALRKDKRFGFGEKWSIGSRSYDRTPYEMNDEYLIDIYGKKATNRLRKKQGFSSDPEEYKKQIQDNNKKIIELDVKSDYVRQNRNQSEKGRIRGTWSSARDRANKWNEERKNKKQSSSSNTQSSQTSTTQKFGVADFNNEVIQRDIINGKSVYSYTKGNTQFTNRSEEDVIKDLGITKEQLDQLEFKRNGGILRVGKLANGGVVYKWQNGSGVRNTIGGGGTNNPWTDAEYANTWGTYQGAQLLSDLDNEMYDADYFINTGNQIQGSYAGAVNASGNIGYNVNNVSANDASKQHMELYNKLYNQGNTQGVEAARKAGVLISAGNSGDNKGGNYVDAGYHGKQNSLRNWGFAANEEARKAFEGSDIYKKIQEAAKKKGLQYGIIKDLSKNGKYYYGFSRISIPEDLKQKIKFRAPRPGDELKAPETPAQTAPTETPTRMAPGRIGDGEQTDPGILQDKKEGPDWGARIAGLGSGLVEPILKTMANNRGTREMIDAIKPNLQIPYREDAAVHNDYIAERQAHDNAAQMRLIGNQLARSTANAELGAATQLAATERGLGMIAEGNRRSADMFYKTRDRAIQTENANRERDTTVANANMAQQNATDVLEAQLRAQNRINNIAGIWGPKLQELQANAMGAAQEKYKQYTAARSLEMDKKYDEMARKAQGLGMKMDEYINTPNGKIEYDKWKKEYYVPQKSVYDFYNGISVLARKGTKVKSSYDYNMGGMDEYTKEFFKNWRFIQGEYTKERIASSKGALEYAKHLSEHVNKTNRLMSYAGKRRK